MSEHLTPETPSDHECDTGNFDRTVCPEPCGRMHSYCDTCGERQDDCAHEPPSDEAAMHIDPEPPGVTTRPFTDAEVAALDADPSSGGDVTADELVRALMGAWEIAERRPVNPSYVATFVDMARTVLAEFDVRRKP